jgi:hypothetical protein
LASGTDADDVRGGRLVASVDSQNSEHGQVDWRVDAELTWEPYQLPEDVERALCELIADLGLRFGAIDLIRHPDGHHVFLEVNPSGQWPGAGTRSPTPSGTRSSVSWPTRPMRPAASDGELVFLELSSAGQWTGSQDTAGHPVREAIARFLADPAASARGTDVPGRVGAPA